MNSPTDALTTIIEKVSFVNNIPLLVSATADDEKPTSGYAFQEINNITFKSGSHCQELLDYLVTRLEKNSYHVKLKVLKILHHLVINGHQDFRHGLRRKATGIREATKYGGPPDPLHGNAPYLMVRQAAQDLSYILFEAVEDDTRNETPEPQHSSASQVISGVGSGMGSSASGGQGKMEGFGNSPISLQKSISDRLVSGVKHLVDQVLVKQDADILTDAEKNFSSYQAPSIPGVEVQEASPDSSFIAAVPVKPKPVYRPGRALGGWEDSDDDDASTAAEPASLGDSCSSTPATPVSRHSDGFPDRCDNRSSIGHKEEETITNFHKNCSSKQPTRQELKDLVKRCMQLNFKHILSKITEKLIPGDDKALMGILLLLETFLHTDYVNIEEIGQVCGAALIQLYTQTEGPVQMKARKIIRILEKLCRNQEPFLNMPKPDRSTVCDAYKPTADSDIISLTLQTMEQGSTSGSPELPDLKLPFLGFSDNTDTSEHMDTSTEITDDSQTMTLPHNVDYNLSSNTETDIKMFLSDVTITAENSKASKVT